MAVLCLVPMESRRRIPWTVVPDSCGLSSGFCESNPGLLKEQTELLTTEPSQVTTERFF